MTDANKWQNTIMIILRILQSYYRMLCSHVLMFITFFLFSAKNAMPFRNT